jgi:hypothetical protein
MPNAPVLLRLAAIPAAHVETDEVVVVDPIGRRYLLDGHAGTLTRLSAADVQMIPTFFDDAGRTDWEIAHNLMQRFQTTSDDTQTG